MWQMQCRSNLTVQKHVHSGPRVTIGCGICMSRKICNCYSPGPTGSLALCACSTMPAAITSKMRQGPMQEHACKEPMDSLAPWWDIIGAFVGEGILHQLEAFLQTMCHAGQSTRSSWNWRKPMRPYGELSWTDCADWSFRSKPDDQLNSKQFKQAKLCYLYLFMVKLLHLLHLLQLHPWSGLNGLILTTKRRIHRIYRIQNWCFIFSCFFGMMQPNHPKRS